jgi:probable rRNA maturation factor
MTIEINNTTKSKINKKLIIKTAEIFLQSRRWTKKDVSIAFIGDAKMRQLNLQYRKKDKTTDVLSFGNSPLERGGRAARTGCVKACLGGQNDFEDLGEIIINPAQIKRQAKANNNSFQAELIFILVHGLLHLAGYNDETEKDRLEMIRRGEKFVENLG